MLGLLHSESPRPLLRRRLLFARVLLGRVNARNRQMGVQPLVNLGQPPVAGRFNQQQVQFAIGLLVPAQGLFVRHWAAQHFQQLFQLLQFGRPQMFNGFFGRQALQRNPHIERCFNIFNRQRGHKGAAARLDLNQPFGRQLLNGMPHRRQTYTQPLGNLVHLQSLARLEHAVQYGIAQRLVHLVGGAFSSQAA